jgi:PKD domain/Immunoglobulin I-set domain
MSVKKVNYLYCLGSTELTKLIARSIVVLSQIISIKHLIRPHYNAYSFSVLLFAIFLIPCMNPVGAVVTDPGPGNYYTCDYSGCTANDLTVTSFTVTDANGNPLSCAACDNGIGAAYVTASVSSTAQNRYNVFLLANGHRYLIAATMNKNTPVKVTIPVTWNCGATNLAITGPGRCPGASGGPVITYSQQDLGANNNKEAQIGTPPVTDCHTGSKCYCLGVQTVAVPCTPDAPDFSICKGTTLNDALFIAQGAGCGGSGCAATYDYSLVNANVVGTYQYTVTCKSGTTCTVSNTGHATIIPLTTITTQPSPQSTCSDGSATFSAAATGSGTLTYQWYKQLGGSPNPSTDTKLTNSAPYSGTTSQTMTINPAISAQASSYYVMATTQCGSAASISVALTIQDRPTASAGPAQEICAGSTVQLAGSASNYSTATWSGGAGMFSPNANALNAVYAPTSAEIVAGTVTLTLTANPKSPCTASATSNVAITMYNPPAANFTAAPILGCGSLTIAFADKSDGNGQNITSWIWNFGDNKTYNGQNPSNHAYSNPGTYTVKLTVANICG